MTAALRSSVALLVVIAVAGVTTTAAPAFAKPNNGAYQNSAEANKTRAKQCTNLKHHLTMAEKAAEEKAGTAAAQPYSDLADQYWAAGVSLGCWQD